MITTIMPTAINIGRAKSYLVLARKLKQTAEVHRDFAVIMADVKDWSHFERLALDAERGAKNARLLARRLLRLEEEKAGNEYCTMGKTSRGAKHLCGKQFIFWSEYAALFGSDGSGDTWL